MADLREVMVTEDNIIIADTTDGIYVLDMNKLRKYPYYNDILNEKYVTDLKKFKHGRDMIIWNENADLYKDLIFEEGFKINV